ncbi:MAG TPA: SMI1/KNR4 family protein [Thermomicrobiales bacterium]|nr:SMI1/KNR4 family protein [Thermomicrobiales bacterium]
MEVDWRALLTRWSAELIAADEAEGEPLPPEVVASGWLGYPGATEAQLSAAEARLGVRLPPSYRQFLAVTNGWRHTGTFIDRLWPAEEIDWFRVRNQDWIDAYTDPADDAPVPLSDAAYRVYGDEQSSVTFRSADLQAALEISDVGDSAILLLNPRVVTPDGEWEAWFFANWLPGATRHPSFRALMADEQASFRRLVEQRRQRGRQTGGWRRWIGRR